MNKKVRWITETAVMLALLVALQALTKGFGQFVTGSEAGGEKQDHRAVGEYNLSGEAAAGGENRFPLGFSSFIHGFIRMEPFSTSLTSISVCIGLRFFIIGRLVM